MPLTCHYYDLKKCEDKGIICHETNKTCEIGQNCVAFWRNYSGNVSVAFKDCFYEGQNECQRPTCKFGTKTSDRSIYYMCCCNTDFCNDEIGLAPKGGGNTWTPFREKTGKLADYFKFMNK